MKPLDIELVSDEVLDIALDLGTNGAGEKYPPYTGSYEAIPKVIDQIFPTKKTSLEDDFTVRQITYLRTINESGGYTVTIGDI